MLSNCLFLLLSGTLAFGGLIKFQECTPGGKDIPVNGNQIDFMLVRIQDCEALPCTLYREQSYVFEFKLKFNFTSSAVRLSIKIIIPGLPPMENFENIDLCSVLDTKPCGNVKPGVIMDFKKLITSQVVSGKVPSIMRVIIRDDLYVSQFCGEMPMIFDDKEFKMPTKLYFGQPLGT